MISIESMVYSGIETCIKQYALTSIRELSTIYGFDYDEAVARLDLDKIEISKTSPTSDATASKATASKATASKATASKATASKATASKAKKVKKPEIELPFCGIKLEGFCSAIKKSGGLYNQCTKPTNNTYCTICQKQADKNSSNKPNLGDISERIEQGDNWCDPSGKKPVKYAKVMSKLNISKEKAIEVAKSFGITISESEFTLDNAKKGRPKKSVSVDDTDDEKEKKKRGRPTKDKIQEEILPGDDLIASLIEEAKNEDNETETEVEKKPKKKSSTKKPKKKSSTKKPKKVSEPEPEPEHEPEPEPEHEPNNDSELDEEDTIEVKKIEIDGETYLLDQNNVVYDEEQNEVGTYNSETKTITYFDNDEEEV
jgi:hypothetical protein